MSVTSTRTILLQFADDVELDQQIAAAANTNSPGQVDIVNLTSGNNTITVPTGGAVAKGVVIRPPAENTVLITFKGVNGDTGVPLHKTDPSSIGIDPTCTTFVLNAASTITGVRLYWS